MSPCLYKVNIDYITFKCMQCSPSLETIRPLIQLSYECNTKWTCDWDIKRGEIKPCSLTTCLQAPVQTDNTPLCDWRFIPVICECFRITRKSWRNVFSSLIIEWLYGMYHQISIQFWSKGEHFSVTDNCFFITYISKWVTENWP